MEDLLFLGGLGIQYCAKSRLAYSRLEEVEDGLSVVEYEEFNGMYNKLIDAANARAFYDKGTVPLS